MPGIGFLYLVWVNNHPAKILFQFTSLEVYSADFRRFNLMFRGIESLLPEDEARVLRDFFGALSISYDPHVMAEAPTALEHPAFPRFASRFFANTPALPFLLTLKDESLNLLFLGSLEKLTTLKVDGADGNRYGFNREEYLRRADKVQENATVWSKKIDMSFDEHRRYMNELTDYLARKDLDDGFGW